MTRFIISSSLLAASIIGFSGYAEEKAPKPTQVSPTKLSTVDGKEVALPVPDKKVTVLVFLSCDCPIANAFAPELGRIYDTYKDKGVAFYRVYPDKAQTLEDIAQHAKDYKHNSPAIRDAEQVLVQSTGARITPEAVVIKPDGAIVYRGRINDLYTDIGKRRREATTADLRDAIDAVLNNKPIDTPETRAFGCYIPLEFEEEKSDAPAT